MNGDKSKPSLYEFCDDAKKNHAPTISLQSVSAYEMTIFNNSEQKKCSNLIKVGRARKMQTLVLYRTNHGLE